MKRVALFFLMAVSVGCTGTSDSVPGEYCMQTYEYTTGESFGPEWVLTPSTLPLSAPDQDIGVHYAVVPVTGQLGPLSWWLRADESAVVTLALAVSPWIRDRWTAVRIYAVVNGRIAATRNIRSGEWGVTQTFTPDLPESLSATVELNTEDLEVGMNTVTFLYDILTASAPPGQVTGGFLSVNVFFETTGVPDIATDNDAIVYDQRPHIPGTVSFVTLGTDSPMLGGFEGPSAPDRLSANDLFVHVQSPDLSDSCGLDGRNAIVMLLDGVPQPIGPDSSTTLLVDVPAGQQVVTRLPLPPLPRSPGHVLDVREVYGVGYPYSSDDAVPSPWSSTSTRLFTSFW